MSTANPNSIQVLSLDSNKEHQLALGALLSNTPGIVLADEAETASAVLLKLKAQHIDVVLLDLTARDPDVIKLTQQIKKSHPEVRVLISTASNSTEDIFAAMEAGADGYLLKNSHTKELKIAISSVKIGLVWLDPAIANQVLEVVIESAKTISTRTLPTGLIVRPLMPDEKQILTAVAASNCKDGLCMVDPNFVNTLRRFSPSYVFE